MYTLRKALREYYKNVNSDNKLENDTDIDVDNFNTFYNEENKKYREAIKLCDIVDEMETLKKLTSSNYSLSERNKNFIIMLLKEYSKKTEPKEMEHIRRAELDKVNSDFIITIYEGFINIFRDGGANSELINSAKLKMYNRLKVPVHMVRSSQKAAYNKLENTRVD